MIKLTYPSFWSSINILSNLLVPLSYIYLLLGYMRKLCTKPAKMPGLVICVGNITVGGTGKTQLVRWLAVNLKIKGYKITAVTKGYASNLKKATIVAHHHHYLDVGDESKLLMEYCDVIATRSVKEALPLLSIIGSDILIFDDGMQNPSFIKDLQILIIDAARAVGNNRIFPAGPLRETLAMALKRTDIIIIIGQLNHNSQLAQEIANTQKPFFNALIQLSTKLDTKRKYYAFAGIGNPQKFFDLLQANNLNVIYTKSFPDHYDYCEQDIQDMQKQAATLGCVLITTRKDYIKLKNTTNILCIDAELNIHNHEKLLQIIDEKAKAYS